MKKIYLLALFVLAGRCCWAQFNTLGGVYGEKFKYEVLSISQFIDRYNYKIAVPGDGTKITSRKNNLAFLFDMSDTSLMVSDVVHVFLDKYLTDSIHAIINYEDSNWEAAVHTTFKFEKRTIKVNLIMGIYPDEYGSKWLIKRVEYQDAMLEYCNNPAMKINPVNNEVDFSELWKAFTWKRNIISYAKDFKPDMTSIFYYQVQHKLIDFQSIDYIQYTFNTMLGYQLLVKKFNRSSPNSGWLIYNIKKI